MILRIFNDTIQGSISNLYITFGGTLQFLEDEFIGLYSYGALKRRLESNKYETEKYLDYSQPVIRLKRLKNEEQFMLLEKIKLIYELGYSFKTYISEEDIINFLHNNYIGIQKDSVTIGKIIRDFVGVINILYNNPDYDKYNSSLKVLYISPLKALINDQFNRVENLVNEMSIRIMKWHGDVANNRKKAFLAYPQGILQITPESLEGFMINRPFMLEKMMSDVEYIIIDEIHAFVGQERGYHLQSLLHRIKKYINNNSRAIALSATIQDIEGFKF